MTDFKREPFEELRAKIHTMRLASASKEINLSQQRADLLAALKGMLAASNDPNATTGEFDTAAGRAYRVLATVEDR